MDTNSVAGSSLLMRAEQTQLVLTMTMMKQAANQQTLLADLLAQNTRQAPQPTTQSNDSVTFSTYA